MLANFAFWKRITLLIVVVSFVLIGFRSVNAVVNLTDWKARKELVVQHNQLNLSSNLTDFPLLITEANLPSELFDADGTNHARESGCDLRFTTDQAGANEVPFQLLNFVTDNDPANGRAEIWLKAPVINSAAATDFWVWYGNAAADCYLHSDPFGYNNVWTNGYKIVYKFNESPAVTPPQIKDSTNNFNDGSAYGTMPAGSLVTGKIGQALTFDGVDDKLVFNNGGVTLGGGSFDVWLKQTSGGSQTYSLLSTPSEISSSTTGLIGLWRFNGTWVDSSGKGYNAIPNTVPANPTFVAGKFGQAASFDGGDTAALNGSPDIADFMQQNFSISAWVNPTGVGTIFGQHDGMGEGGWDLRINAGGKLEFSSLSMAGGEQNITIGATTLTPGQWYQVALTINVNNAILYVNGKEDAIIGRVPISYGPQPTHSLIGQRLMTPGSEEYFNGVIDELAAYDYDLSASEVMGIYLGKLSLYRQNDNLIFAIANKTLTSDISGWLTEWHHLVASFDGANANLYIDNSLVANSAYNSTAFSLVTTSYLANDSSGGSAYAFNGQLDNFSLANSSRSADWAKAEYLNQNNPGPIVLVTEEATPTDTNANSITTTSPSPQPLAPQPDPTDPNKELAPYFKVVINDGAATTTNQEVELSFLNVGQDVIRMAISNSADFLAVSQEAFTNKKTWLLSEGLGAKEVYVKFYNSYGMSTEPIIGSIELINKELPFDIVKDNVIDILDFNTLMTNWGKTGDNIADLNHDQKVDLLDFNLFIANWHK